MAKPSPYTLASFDRMIAGGQPMPFNVMGEVRGGITGPRQALVKKGGTVMVFETFDEAQAHAEYLLNRMNHGASVALFMYWAVSSEPVDDAEYFSQPVEDIHKVEDA